MCLHFFLFFLGVVFRVLHTFEKSTHIIASFNLLMSNESFEQIKDFDILKLTKEQELLIDKIILDEELKKRYK